MEYKTTHVYFQMCEKFIIVVFGLIFCTQNIYANEPVVVHTQYGDILGYQTNLARVFYGIPFAQPPINTLR